MKNNKGFTVVELLASFSLTMVIVVFLFEILVEIKNLYSEANTKTEVIQKQAVLINKIRNTFDTKELTGVSCAKNECFFNFYDSSQTLLTINPDNNTIVYDGDKYTFPAEVRFTEYGVETCDPKNDLATLNGHTAKDCYFKIHITISSSSLDKDYPINIVYPYIYDPSFLSGDLNIGSDYAGSKILYMCKEESQTFTAERSGTYRIELLGARGGSSGEVGGAGAYTSGEIYLKEGEELYVNVGCTPKNAENSTTEVYVNGGYNGGGNGSSADSSGGGGGATDVRFGGKSLNDRIMVAAGGSGASNKEKGVPGGTLISANSSNSSGPKGATQTSGSSFGEGAAANDSKGGSGGGGGYYGGAGGTGEGITGTGGSSYISGHLGSNAITSSSSQTPTNQSIHYSGKFFYETVMFSGDKMAKDQEGEDKTAENVIGSEFSGEYNKNDGYALITYIDSGEPEEATRLSSIKANYPLGSSVWLDGHNNDKSSEGTSFIHNYKANPWGNFGTNGNNMSLDFYKWKKDGLDLSSKGEISLDISEKFTLSAVFSLTSYPNSMTALIDGKIGISIDSNGKVFFVNNGTSLDFDYKISKLNIKEYLTVVGTGQKIKLYSNGVMLAEISLETNAYTNTLLKLSGSLNGTLHRISFYPTDLSSDEVNMIYEEDLARFNVDSNPVHYVKTEYKFDSEDYLYDSKYISDFSGNSNDATLVGTNNFDENNKGLILNGNTYLEIPGNINYRYTAVLVVSSSDVNNTPSLMGESTYPSLYINSGKYAFKAQGVNSAFTQNFSTSKKEYITITYDGTNVNLYLDGIKKANLGTTVDPVSVEKAYIGKSFKGNLYKYALYDRVLLDEEIKTIFEYDYNVFK